MYIILSILAFVLVFAPWIAGGALLLFALWRALGNFRAGRSIAGKIWVAVAMSPVIFIGLAFASFGSDERDRARLVSGLERLKLDGVHPSRLIVRGYMLDAELAVLLHLYDFETIEIFGERQTRANRGSRLTRANGSNCRQWATSWLIRRSYELESKLKTCVDREIALYKPGMRADDTVLFLMGHATTLKASNDLWSSGNYEVRLLAGGKDRLVDYWERYRSKRQMSLLCMAALAICRADHRSKGPGRLKFLIHALGHEVPSKSL